MGSDTNTGHETKGTSVTHRRYSLWKGITHVRRFLGSLSVLVGVLLAAGCGKTPPEVIAYAAQDRVFAEPIFGDFERQSGIRARALYDSEATKTVGLANRLMAEARRPQADVWWSNEEMRTRQLAARGVLEAGWKSFGARRRVLVVRTNSEPARRAIASLRDLTNAVWRGRVAMAYPVFGSTTTHLLALRQRWGDGPWKEWCRDLAANRPMVVDGNSVVVRLVGRGDVEVGLTDSDDVAFGRREGLPVEAIALKGSDGLRLPNTVARVSGGPHPAESGRLVEYLAGASVAQRLAGEGAIDAEDTRTGAEETLTEVQWSALLAEMDPALDWLREVFVR